MAITFDDYSGQSGGREWSHVIGNHQGRILLFQTSCGHAGGGITGATFDGVDVEIIQNDENFDTGDSIAYFYIVNPNIGTHTVHIVGGPDNQVSVAASYYGVNTSNPIGTKSYKEAYDDHSYRSPTALSSDWIVSMICVAGGIPSGNKNVRVSEYNGYFGYRSALQDSVGPTVSMNWDWSPGNSNFAHLSIPIHVGGVEVGGSVTPTGGVTQKAISHHMTGGITPSGILTQFKSSLHYIYPSGLVVPTGQLFVYKTKPYTLYAPYVQTNLNKS